MSGSTRTMASGVAAVALTVGVAGEPPHRATSRSRSPSTRPERRSRSPTSAASRSASHRTSGASASPPRTVCEPSCTSRARCLLRERHHVAKQTVHVQHSHPPGRRWQRDARDLYRPDHRGPGRAGCDVPGGGPLRLRHRRRGLRRRSRVRRKPEPRRLLRCASARPACGPPRLRRGPKYAERGHLQQTRGAPYHPDMPRSVHLHMPRSGERSVVC